MARKRIAPVVATYAAELNRALFPLVGYYLSTAKAETYRLAGYNPQEAAEEIDSPAGGCDSRGWGY